MSNLAFNYALSMTCCSPGAVFVFKASTLMQLAASQHCSASMLFRPDVVGLQVAFFDFCLSIKEKKTKNGACPYFVQFQSVPVAIY